jgi:hypothetical protein
MHENAARALQYYEDLPRRSGRPELRLVDAEPRPRRRETPPRSRGDERRARAADRRPARDGRRGARGRTATPARAPKAPVRARLALPVRRRTAVAPRIAGRPDRVAMWAVLLGFFLTAVAAATGHG